MKIPLARCTGLLRNAGYLCTTLLAVTFSAQVLAQQPQQHAVGVGKSCPQATKVGDLAECFLTATNRDEFGDDLVVNEFWDVIDPGGPLQFRNPAAGNLPIVAVSTNVACTPAPVSDDAPIGLVFPCVLDGETTPAGGNGSGEFVEVASRYIVPEGAEDPLLDQANVLVQDDCNVQPIGCNPDEQQQQFGAAVSLFTPSLEVTKTGPATAKVGDEISYAIGFADTSTGTGFPGFENCTGTDTLLGNLGAFVAGVDRQFNYVVQAGDPDPLPNTATITCGVVGFDNELSDEDSHSVDVINPAIDVTKSGPALAKVGDELTYTIGFTATADADFLGTCTGSDTLLGNLGEFENGVDRQFNYVVQAGDPNPLPNTATITCDIEGFNNQASDFDSHSVDLIDPAIDVTKTGPDLAKVGDEITYTIGFTATANGDLLGNCTGTDTLLGNLGAFEAGVDRQFNYVVQAGDSDPLPNTATITCDIEGFNNQASDFDSHSVDLINPSVEISKECRPDPLEPGDTIEWAITIDNTGDAPVDCLVNDAEAGLTDEPVSVAAGGSETVNASRTVEASDEPVISNTANVSCQVSGFENQLGGEASADCEVVVAEEICRTIGFWMNHSGEEKRNSTNLTQLALDAAGGSISVCGQTIDSTNVGDPMSALEALCAKPKGDKQIQLARQLTGAALNCIISGGDADCSGTSVATLWAEANAACIANSSNLSKWIDAVDAFNNAEYCHERELSESSVFDGVEKLPGPAGSSWACKQASNNNITIFP